MTAALLVVGAVLELAGIALVGVDVLDSRRTLKKMSSPNWLSEEQQPGRRSRSLFELMAAVAAGNLWRRAGGVALFACGLVFQTAGNLAAL
jgi:hypothetical protein